MAEIVNLSERIAAAISAGDTPDLEIFLLAEGLDLLDNFRAIADADVRLSITKMIKSIRKAQDLTSSSII